MTRFGRIAAAVATSLLLWGCPDPTPTFHVILSPQSTTVVVGETVQLAATVYEGSGRELPGMAVTWQSADPRIATVNTTGVVTGVAAGTVKIHATAEGTTSSASATIVVTPRRFDLTVAKNGSGTVTSSPAGIDCGATCTATFDEGTVVTLAAVPDVDFAFAGWSGACTGKGACPITLGANATVTASFEPTSALSVTVSGAGSVTSAPAGIDCPAGACSASFVSGTSVELTAQAAAGSYFAGWSGACTGTDPCTVVVSAATPVTATFAPLPVLSVSVSGEGQVSSTPAGIQCPGSACSGAFTPATTVTLTATASPGSAFTGWGGDCTGSGPCVVVLTADASVTATFVRVQTLSVTIAGSGTITSEPAGLSCSAGTCSAQFPVGTSVTLSAAPGTDFAFGSWSGDCTGTAGCGITMAAGVDSAVTATFVRLFTLDVTASAGGTVTSTPAGISCPGTCSAQFAEGTSVALAATPDGDHVFGDYAGACTGSSCSLAMNADQAVTASFIALRTITVNAAGPGTVTSTPAGINCSRTTCTARFPDGTALSLSQVAASGVFTGWGNACTGTGACAFTVAADATVDASFFDWKVSVSMLSPPLSMVPLEARTVSAVVDIADGPPAPVSLSVSGLPAGVTGSFSPPSLTPFGSSQLTLTADVTAVPSTTTVTVTASIGTVQRTATFDLVIRDPFRLTNPFGVAVEAGGTTALITEADRLVRIDLATWRVIKTVVTGLNAPRSIAIEAGGYTALVAANTALIRVSLETGYAAPITTALNAASGVAIESGGTTALVTYCTGDCTTTGRLARVDLASGTVTNITSAANALNTPLAVMIEPSGSTALISEYGAGRVTRVVLGMGGVVTLASNVTAPSGLALEPGGQTALVSAGTDLRRITLATGIVTPIASVAPSCCAAAEDLAIEPGGATALVASISDNRLVRARLDPVPADVGPSAQSPQALLNPWFLAVEAGGATALVTDCGSANTNACGPTGWLARLALDTGMLTAITPSGALSDPRGLALEAGGLTALVVEQGAGQLSRVDLATGAVTPIASGFQEAIGVAIEPGGLTALVSAKKISTSEHQLYRVVLATGAVAVASQSWAASGVSPSTLVGGVSVEPDGAHALVATGSSLVYRVDLGTGALTDAFRGPTAAYDVAVEAGGTTALVTDNSTSQVVRLDLATGSHAMLAPALNWYGNNAVRGIAPMPGGTGALVVHANRVLRVPLTAGATSLAEGLQEPCCGQPEPGGSTALMLDCAGPTYLNCSSSGRLLRVGLSSHSLTPLLTGLNNPRGLALEGSGASALITDCGASGVPGCTGRLIRVALPNTVSVLATNLNAPDAIAIEAGGTTALVAERGAGRLLRVDLSFGASVPIAAGLDQPNAILIEPGGATALVQANGVVRVDLATGVITPVMLQGGALAAMALEPSGTLLGIGMQYSSGFFPGSLIRVDLATRKLDVLAQGVARVDQGLVLLGGGSALVAARREGGGGLYAFTVPP